MSLFERQSSSPFMAAGFVGRYIARQMAKKAARPRLSVPPSNEAIFVLTYVSVGQVEPILLQIVREVDAAVSLAAMQAPMRSFIASVFCQRARRTILRRIQNEGAARIARLAAEAGITRLVHISPSVRMPGRKVRIRPHKALAKQAILSMVSTAVILAPLDHFEPKISSSTRCCRMTRMARSCPSRANTRLQPVYVEDVAQAAVLALLVPLAPGFTSLADQGKLPTFRNLMAKHAGPSSTAVA